MRVRSLGAYALGIGLLLLGGFIGFTAVGVTLLVAGAAFIASSVALNQEEAR